tara:strand:- start:61 stop:726 length:666 start_codon:yes stop_codon:yes gene_type:complete
MKIGFFGCSFTEGGGLNSEEFYNWGVKNNLIKKLNLDDYKGNFSALYDDVRRKYRFSTLVGKKLNAEVTNFGKGCSSNEFIFNQLYKHYKEFDVCVVQLSVYSRRYQWEETDNKFYHINDVDNYTLNHFNWNYAREQVSMMIDLFDSLNKKIYWLFHEDIPKTCKSNNIIRFGDNGHLHDFVMRNKLTFKHETNGYYNDLHYSIKGNKIIADKISEKINEK